MAYQTGVALGAVDLLDKLRLFAEANGWTTNRWASVGSGYQLCLQKGSAYFNLRAFVNEAVLINGGSFSSRYGIGINGSDGYASGNAWDVQPGYPLRTSTSGGNQAHAYLPMVTNFGPFPAYHMFAPDSKTIYMELEITTGVFQRLGFGSLDLFNSMSPGGGRFFYATGGSSYVTNSTTGSSWLGGDVDNGSYSLEEVPFRAADYLGSSGSRLSGSFLRSTFDSFDSWCQSYYSTQYAETAQVCQGGGCHDKVIRDANPNPLNGVGVLLPNVVSVNRGNEFLNPVGVVPGMRYMDMTNYLPGDEFTLGTDTWKVFPWYQKGGRSGQRGIAYLKVT